MLGVIDGNPGGSPAERFSIINFSKDNIFLLLFVSGSLFSLYYAVQGWNGSLMEKYAFRQAQTAITVQYLLRGGPLLAYETPVLGPPWSIPLEFPFYQYLVFLVVKLTGYGIEQAGRLVSLLLFSSALYPFYFLIKSFFVKPARAYIALLLLCISPVYLFYYRSFMIESTALALSLWYLYFIKKQSESAEKSGSDFLLLALIFVFGIVAAITKITTFFAYYAVGALFILANLHQHCKKTNYFDVIKKNLVLLVVALVIPFLATIAWTHYTDTIKALNPIGVKLTSAALKTHNFGSLELRLSLGQWVKAITRSLADLVGTPWLFALTFALLPFCRKRTAGMVLLLIFLFLLPMTVFTSLYFVHSYYIYANGILLLLALALVVGDLSSRSTPWFLLSIALLGVICFSSGRHYLQEYYPMQGNDYRYQEIKEAVDVFTKKDDVLVFYGADWSAEMPFYLERRSLMLEDRLLTPEIRNQAVENMRSYPVGAVVLCRGARDTAELRLKTLTEFSSHFPTGFQTVSFQWCDFYFKPRSPNL